MFQLLFCVWWQRVELFSTKADAMRTGLGLAKPAVENGHADKGGGEGDVVEL